MLTEKQFCQILQEAICKNLKIQKAGFSHQAFSKVLKRANEKGLKKLYFEAVWIFKIYIYTA